MAAVGLLCCGMSTASPILFSGTSGDKSASVAFAYENEMLTLTLTNTATGGIVTSADLLTGVYFSVANGVSLTPVSATGNVLNTDDPNVGGNWGYAIFASPYFGATQGVSATGMGLFHNGNFGCTLGDCKNLDGAGYGLAPGGYPEGANPALQILPVIQSSVTLTFSGVSSAPEIQNVWFQYGSTLADDGFPPDQPTPPPVPEPGAIVLTSIGLALLGIGMKYRRNRA